MADRIDVRSDGYGNSRAYLVVDDPFMKGKGGQITIVNEQDVTDILRELKEYAQSAKVNKTLGMMGGLTRKTPTIIYHWIEADVQKGMIEGEIDPSRAKEATKAKLNKWHSENPMFSVKWYVT